MNTSMATEVWRRYRDSRYYVSSFGNVMNRTTKQILSPEDTGYGYLCVGIILNGEYKKVRVHRMVAETFIPRIGERNEVDHLNGDKSDNSVGNLRWATHSENMNNPVTRKKIAEAFSRNKKSRI